MKTRKKEVLNYVVDENKLEDVSGGKMPLTHLPNPKPLQVNADGSVVSGADTLALADKLALADTDTLALAGTDKLADTLSANNPHENDKKLI